MSGVPQLVVISGGEHARVVLDAALSSGWSVAGYLAPERSVVMQRRYSLRWLGTDDMLDELAADRTSWFILGLGAQTARVRWLESNEHRVPRWATICHDASWISPSATLGRGVTVMAGAQINTGVRAGAHAIVNTGAVLEHDVVLERCVHVAPAAALGGGATVGVDSMIGLGARVRDHVRIGERAMVGMGAVVVSDVADDTTVVGVPARQRGLA